MRFRSPSGLNGSQNGERIWPSISRLAATPERVQSASLLFGVGSDARSASKSDPSPRTATHCIDELIARPTRVTVGSRLLVKSQADSQ